MSKLTLKLLNEVVKQVKEVSINYNDYKMIVSGKNLNRVYSTDRYDNGKAYLVSSKNNGLSWDIEEVKDDY